jgi:hypothetical protein
MTYVAWVALPGAYIPASIALRAVWAPKPLHKAIVLEEDIPAVITHEKETHALMMTW